MNFGRFSKWTFLKKKQGEKPPFEFGYIYILLAFIGFSISDLSILSIRHLLLPTQAPPLPSSQKKPSFVPTQMDNVYQSITQRNIFNSDGKIPDPVSKKEEGLKAEGPSVPSSLPLNLIGTIVHLNPAKSVATIELKGKNKVKSYSNGADVEGIGKILKIERKKVTFRNLNNRQLEHIEIKSDLNFNFGFKASSQTSSKGDVKQEGQNQFKLDRSVIMKYTTNLPELLQQARAVPYTDASGKVGGFRLLDMQPGSIFEKLGLHKNDIIKSVNGQPVDSPAKAMELYNSLKNSASIAIGVERDGKDEDMKYNISD